MDKIAVVIVGGVLGVGLGHYHECYNEIKKYKQFLINIEKTKEFEKYKMDVFSYNYHKDKGSMHMKYGDIGTYYVYENKTEIMHDIPPEFIHRTVK